MRRADRLFQIVQILRRSPRPVTAASVAEELETSKRSVYRDVAALIGQGVPIRGEAGVGYVLEAGFDMPPLMLTTEELEAAVLGAQWVVGHGDADLARAANDLLAKLAAVVPTHLQAAISDAHARTPPAWNMPPDSVDVAELRRWARVNCKVLLRYRDAQDAESTRIVWPVIIAYAADSRRLVAWCETRGQFRTFRLDRAVSIHKLPEKYPETAAALRRRWFRHLRLRRDDEDLDASSLKPSPPHSVKTDQF